MKPEAALPPPPLAKVVPKEITKHDDLRVDPYYWLRERSNPEVTAYLEAENAYTEEVMRPAEALREKLYAEMLGRIKEDDVSAPMRHGGWLYYHRTERGKAYPIYCRKRGTLEATEELLLDANVLAAGEKYFRLGVFALSPNHELLAYSTDVEGDEAYTIHVKDLRSGELLPDRIPNTYYTFEWANDNRTFFYTVLDETKRPFKVFRHRLGGASDLAYHEQDARFELEVTKSRSREYVFIASESPLTSEVRRIRADQPESEFQVVLPREQGVEYDVEHQGEWFFIRTNEGAPNFRLMRTAVAAPSKEHWTEIVAGRVDATIEAVDAFREFLVLAERERGLETVRIAPANDLAAFQPVEFPEPVYAVAIQGNPEYESKLLRFTYQSLVTPPSVYHYNMETRQRELIKRDEVPGYGPSQYGSERIWARASDGVEVPISLVYRKGVQRNGANPMLLYGYGSYGLSSDPGFTVDRLSLLDRGFIFAIAHIRGGGDLGKHWHDAGKLLTKLNTFTDFIACAEHVIAQGYTSPGKLAIRGGSAGGLLVGAVINMRPELFHAASVRVPFVDALTTMLDPTLPLTVAEYEEWGNPEQAEFYRYIRSYSPYDHVEAKAYPAMLVTSGINDPRVSYWEPAKWVDKLRALKTAGNVLLLKMDMGAGHFGPSGRYERLKEVAFDYAFLLQVAGMG